MTLHVLSRPDHPVSTDIVQLISLAFRIANRDTVRAVMTHADSVTHAGADGTTVTWYDLAPMLSVKTHGAAAAFDHGESIAYLLSSGLAERHPDDPMRVRIVATI